MRRLTVALIVCVGLIVTSAYSKSLQGQPVPGKLHKVQKERLRFSDYGIAFNYPSSLQISTETKPGLATVMIESEASPYAMIQVYENAQGTKEIRNSLLKTFHDEYLSRNAEILDGSGKAVSREIGGIKREGRMLELRFMGQPMNIEVYAFRKGENVIGIVMQYATEDLQLVEKYFSTVMESLG